MPTHRYQRREPTHDWQHIRPLLKDQAQVTYELIRPVILFGVNPTERTEETGISRRTISYKANLFDTAGIASLLPPEPAPSVPKLDKRTLPPPNEELRLQIQLAQMRGEHSGVQRTPCSLIPCSRMLPGMIRCNPL